MFRSRHGKSAEETVSGKAKSQLQRNDAHVADLQAIWNELISLKRTVENEHDHKLRRIESDLRWTMTLVAAQFITLIGSTNLAGQS